MAWTFPWLSHWLQSLPSAPSIVEDELPEDDRVFEDASPVVGVPAGKGIFVQSVERATAKGTPAGVAERARDLDLSWVALLTIWQHDDTDRIYNLIQPTILACDRVNVNVFLWGWPHGDQSRIDRFSLFMGELYDANPIEGIILNAEKPLYGKPQAAEALCQAMRDRLPETPLGLSSYGLPAFHPRFPWAPFVKVCQFGMPQIYDSEHTLGASYPQRCMSGWNKLGFSALAPTWGASKAHTAAQMRDIIERTPRAPACCWWDCNWLRSSTARAAVVRQMNWFKGNT